MRDVRADHACGGAGGKGLNMISHFEEIDYDELLEPIRFRFAMDRRAFVQVLGAGVVITAIGTPTFAQRRGRNRGGFFGGPPAPLSARFHFAEDGTITVLSGKVDAGQGARCELAQAAAEELRVPVGRIKMELSNTASCPNDGMTAGSGTTPRTVPTMRQAAAALRKLLTDRAAEMWSVDADAIQVEDGKLEHPATKRSATYIEIAVDPELAKRLGEPPAADTRVSPPDKWTTLGTEQPAPLARDKVTGRHEYPSDIKRPGMLYGKVLRSPKYRAKLLHADLAPAKAMDGIIGVEDGEFIGVVGPTAFAAARAIEAVAKTATRGDVDMPDSDQLAHYLRAHAEGGAPKNPFAEEAAKAPKFLQATYIIPYVQHAPLEPRTAVAEWIEGRLKVWTATQNPFGVRSELANALHLSEDSVHVVVRDFGSAYGGKHTGECAIEAARLAQAAKKPVMLRWTREEEFTAAYFRPAAVMDLEASLDDAGRIATWWHVNINAGGNAVESPYNIAQKKSQSVGSKPPLRHGSYRALAATGNTFARESFMDEMAHAAQIDPLEFRLSHLEEGRLRAVLEDAAKRFNWAERVKNNKHNRAVGLACGTEKGSFVACCAEVEIDEHSKTIRVTHVTESFDCGPALNPDNLRNQMEGAITMGLGPALREEIEFADGVITNGNFRDYRVPQFKDAPSIEVHAMNRTDVDAAGAGETPIIGIAPAIGNAVFAATGQRLRSLPLKLNSSTAS
jgi:CO/xanthine dehydrogenase Mo-binding subunit